MKAGKVLFPEVMNNVSPGLIPAVDLNFTYTSRELMKETLPITSCVTVWPFAAAQKQTIKNIYKVFLIKAICRRLLRSDGIDNIVRLYNCSPDVHLHGRQYN